MSFVGEGIGIQKRSNKGSKGKSINGSRELHRQQQQQEIMGGKVVIGKEEKTSVTTTTTTSRDIIGGGDVGESMSLINMNVMMGWEEWPYGSCWWNVMEEQMIWGCVMVAPGWDEMDFKGGLCGHNEVVWEDDLWCLRDIKHAPY